MLTADRCAPDAAPDGTVVGFAAAGAFAAVEAECPDTDEQPATSRVTVITAPQHAAVRCVELKMLTRLVRVRLTDDFPASSRA